MPKNMHMPEGATPISDWSDLIPKWVHCLSDLNIVEAENIRFVQQQIYIKRTEKPEKWMTPTKLLKTHKEMFNKVWKWAGKYREAETSIGIKPYLIPSALSDLFGDVCYWESLQEKSLSYIERAARIHHRLVYIHPFTNGNGRFSRLIADRYLLYHKCSFPIWPEDLHMKSSQRNRYIQTLKKADKGSYAFLEDLMYDLGANNKNAVL